MSFKKKQKYIMLDPCFNYNNGEVIETEEGMLKILDGEFGYTYLVRELYLWEKIINKILKK